jgi:membrane-associated phospholipid phosphatase
MNFLYFLEGLRTPILDKFMSLITHLGDETVFLVLALLLLWCVDKKRGYLFLIVGFVGIITNQLLKLTFRIPRPWIKDPNFTTVGEATERAGGYSFPSGHTQNVTDSFGCIARSAKARWLRILCIVIIALVGFSRMYLGVHTPLDVLVSLGIGALLVLVAYPLLEKALSNKRGAWILLASLCCLSIGFVLLTELYFPTVADIDAHNLSEGQSNAYTMLGCSLAILPVYWLDQQKIKFRTSAPLLGQACKLVLGAAIAVALKALLKQPLIALFGDEYIARAVRYFIIVVFAGALWPLTFPLFARLGKKGDPTD